MEGELRFTIHARIQMVERKVTEAEIREALANVDRERVDPAGIVRWGKTRRGRRIKIVVDRDDPRFVVTLAAPGEGG
jgi:hypothetical protein